MLWWTLRQLRSHDSQTSAQAARRLAVSREARAVPALIEKLDDVIVGEVVASALGMIGAPAVPALLERIGKGPDWGRRRAIEALGLSHDPRAVEPLLALLDDRNGSVFSDAARALGQIGDRRALEPLKAKLAGGGSRDGLSWRAIAVGALGSGRFQAPELVDLLLGVLEDPKDETGSVKRLAIEGLARIGDPACVGRLFAGITAEGNYGLWEVGTDLLAAFGPAAIGVLLGGLEHGESSVRYVAAMGFRKLVPSGTLGSEARRVREALVAVRSRGDRDVAKEASRALETLDGTSAEAGAKA